MIDIILFFIGWIGSILVLSGLLLISSKKASNPEIRLKGFIGCVIGCIMLSIISFYINAYDLLITNIGVSIINIRGLINCKKEIIKKDE